MTGTSRPHTILTVLTGIALLVTLPGADVPPMFKISTRKDSDSIEWRSGKAGCIFDIRSPTGISRGVIERLDETWPAAITLRLHLKGLESLRLSHDRVTLAAAVAGHDQKLTIRQWQEGTTETPLDTDSPYWMEIRALEASDRPAKSLPLKQGWFEVRLPPAFLKEQPQSITLEWIDFYRN